jgi:hypothetical protein
MSKGIVLNLRKNESTMSPLVGDMVDSLGAGRPPGAKPVADD